MVSSGRTHVLRGLVTLANRYADKAAEMADS